MKGKLYLAFLTVAAFLLIVISVPAPIIIPPPGGGGTVSGSITGAYSFNGPFSTVNATNVYLDASISNLVANLANTNKFNQWQIWADPAVTNRYHAENRALNLKTNSTDFSALLQSIFNRGTEGYSIKVEPNPFYTNAYVMSNTVTITNWGSVMGSSAGNPTVVFRAASGFTNYLFQLGTVGVQIGGISSWRDVRFEGDQGADNSGGIHLVNCVEPVIDRCEFTGFKETSFWVDTTNKLHWTFVNLTWFVGKSASHTAIKFTRQPIEEIALNHFIITDSHFGGVGKGIVVSNHWSNIRIARNTFFSGMGAGVELYGGDRYQIIDNQFVGFTAGVPIYFMDQTGATNFNSEAFGNRTDTDGPVVVLGDFIQGVKLGLNSSKGGTDPVFFTGNNGGINNIDQTGVTATSILTTGRNTNTSGGFWTTDVSGFVSLTDINNYFLLSQPQGGLFATLDNWVFGLSGVNIANWSTNTSGVASNWSVGGSMFLPLLPNQGTIGTDSNGKIVAGTGGSSGGTNFPAVLLQVGNTNYTLQAGKRTSHYMITNLNHGLDADLAAPASGHSFYSRITNSAGTNITVTFYTNGVVATYYESIDQTNSGTSFIVPAGSVVGSEFTWLGNYWIREQKEGPELRISAAGSIVTLITNGLNLVITNGILSGSGANVLSNAPVIFTPTLVFPVIQDATVQYGIAWTAGTVSGVGGANTNFTLQAYGVSSRPVQYIDAGTTNVNIVAIMQGQNSVVNRGTLILTNRTGTSRIFSLGATTNNWISLQQFDGISAPFTITNSQAGRFEWEIHGTNVQYAFKPMALPTN